MKIIIVFINLMVLLNAKILMLDKNCATAVYQNNYFIVACKNKILKINKNLKIEASTQNQIEPIETFKTDKNIYLIDKNDTLYLIEKNLELKKIKKINLDKNSIFNLDSLNKWTYIEKNILYLSLMSADNFPIIVKFNLSNNKEVIYKIKLKNCKPFTHVNYQKKDLVFCRNLKKTYDAIYDLEQNKVVYKSKYSGFYIIKKVNGTLKTIGLDYLNKKLFIMDFKNNFYNKKLFPIFLIPHFVFNNGVTIYGNLMNQKDGKSKAIIKYDTNNKSVFFYDDAPFYVLPLKIYNNGFKALFVYYNKISKVYIFNSNGKLIKTFKIHQKLLPSYSKLFIIDSKIFLWNFNENSKKFYLYKLKKRNIGD